VKHVHDRKILHRDLKSQNIFLTKTGIIKLGDFGISRVLNSTKSKAQSILGTPYYCSPEILKSDKYSFKSDIWSLGCILYEMCALQPPFIADTMMLVSRKIMIGKYDDIPSSFSSEVSNIIKQILVVDPEQRPNIN
jgi:NIMA (never in mitosis gene a)-related kinase